MIKANKKALLTTVVSLVIFSTSSFANIWREIEVVVFQQLTGQDKLREAFPVDISPVELTNSSDFITRLIQPDVKALRDGLPICFKEPVPLEEQYPLDFSLQLLPDDHPLLNDDLTFEELNNTTDGSVTDKFHLKTASTSQFVTTAQTINSIPNNIENDNQQQKHKLDPFIPEFAGVAKNVCVFEQELDVFNTAPVAKTSIEAKQVPSALFAPEIADQLAYLVSAEYAQLTDVVKNIRRSRNMRVMLHSVWRQNILAGRKGRTYRLFAGNNFDKDYYYSGLSKQLALPKLTLVNQLNANAETAISGNLMEQIYQAIETAGPELLTPKVAEQPVISFPPAIEDNRQVWQLDGTFRLYLKYVNRVPYMFIDWNMDYRQPGEVPEKYQLLYQQQALLTDKPTTTTLERLDKTQPPQYLHAYKFKQTRRMISKEVHYFDHPYFGIIMQIRRFQPSQPAE